MNVGIVFAGVKNGLERGNKTRMRTLVQILGLLWSLRVIAPSAVIPILLQQFSGS